MPRANWKAIVLFAFFVLASLVWNAPASAQSSLPSGWLDSDLGSVGLTGSATYSSGTFTVKGAGIGITGTSDGFHFAYQTLSGDGTIVARVVSVSNISYAGVMIRETLNSNSTNAVTSATSSTSLQFAYRGTTGGTESGVNAGGLSLPYWVKVVRSGSTFSGYRSPDGVNWTQQGSSQTISMATSVYVGLAVSSGSTSSLGTATFDNVSIDSTAAPAPVISSVSATTGTIGSSITITGLHFGTAQGSSYASLNGLAMTISSWSDTSISAAIPTGGTSGPIIVAVNPSMNVSNYVNFTVTIYPMPPSWLDQDSGYTGVIGSTTYSSGTFTVKGAGVGIAGTADGFHFAYQPLSGDGTIVARVVSVSNISYAGVMIRETLNSNSTNAVTSATSSTSLQFAYRGTTGGTESGANVGGLSLPYWVKVVRSGSTFSGYRSPDGVNWTQTGTSHTISMATNVYIGLAVSSGSTSALGTATFDNVSIDSAAAPAPVISGISPTTGPVGTLVTITGSHFGTTQGSSYVSLNGLAMTISSWSDTSISAAIPTGGTSGPIIVAVNPSMNVSNYVNFTVTIYPMPPNWLDQDSGYTGVVGSATYSSGTFTVKGAGAGITGTADGFHFAYQALSGDGTIVARVVSVSNISYAGVMIRETLNSNSTNAVTSATSSTSLQFAYRATTGSTEIGANVGGLSMPYWVKVVRSGSTFSGYRSPDGINWTQTGTSHTISMASTVYVGLAVSSGSTSSLGTAMFDNVSIDSAAAPAPVISGLSPTTGAIGSQVTITGAHFGTTIASSFPLLNSVAMPVTSWSDTSITAIVPPGASSGQLVVVVDPSMFVSNPVNFTVTNFPLPSGLLDLDIGSTGLTGSATYSSGTFTVNGAGIGITGTSDGFHFAYQPLSGDGTIVARVVSLSGTSYAGVMIRETLNSNSTNALTDIPAATGVRFTYRATTGGTETPANVGGLSMPYWVKVVRSGSSFSGYRSADGVNWTQIASTQTISMATNVYIGLAVSSGSTSALGTATFDNVSIDSAPAAAPVISSVSATTGTIGSSVTLTGNHFGASQGTSAVFVNDLPMTINSWSNTSISITIASGAVSGYLGVAVAPTMDASNPVTFTVTSSPLPTGWLDQDIGTVGVAGSAGFTGGTFTVKGAGAGISGTSDGFHFAYQPLSGDGTIVARVVSLSGTSYAGVMIRETLNSNSTNALTDIPAATGVRFTYRATTGGTETPANVGGLSMPYWVKVVRSGSTFSGYRSPGGINWTQTGTSHTISMATNVYIGLAVSSGSTSTLGAATFDNATVLSAASPTITGISPASGPIATSVTINGSAFGTTQGSVYFNGIPAASITSWADTQVVAVVPSAATSGLVGVIANGIGANGNFVFTVYNPIVGSLAPAAGPIGGSIVVSGTGFGVGQGTSIVQFNGTTASVTAWSDTSVTATVPTGATSGPVTITEGGITSNGVSFSVIEATTVTGLSPNSGPAGTSVVITGTGFGPSQSDSVVTFYGGTATTITSWSDTSITAVVPSGAITGNVTVTVAGISVVGPVFTLSSTVTLTDSLSHSSTYSSAAIGGTWLYTDSDGSGCSSCTVRGVTHNTYDSRGNALSTVDPAGHTTTRTYDSTNNLLSESTPLDGTHTATTSYTYNTFGEVLTVTDPLGNVTTNAYDAHGNLTSVTSPAPGGGPAASVTTFAYDTKGELTSITDPLGHVTTMTYTTAGLIATITDAQSHVTTYSYDPHGNRTSVTDALSHQTTFAYDSGDRLTTITYPDTTTSTFTYDSRGRRTSVTDQNGKTASYAYDDADRLTSVTDAASHVTYYAFDTESNLTSIQDANSNQTAFSYDAYGRVTNTNFPSSLSETYAYDADNNLTSKTDRKGQTINYVYDALNRLTAKQYPDSTEVDYVYDLVGKITQVNDPTGTYAFAYNNMGRLIGTTTSYSFLTSRNFTNAYTYDAASNRTGFTDPESGSTSYSYDTLNRLTSLAPPSAFGSGSFGFSYDALSRRTQMTRPNSVATNYSYDNLSRLSSVLHQLSGSTIDGASYTLDAAGNRTSKTDYLAAVTSNYTYDAIYQLTQATQGGGTTESYSYDAVGNRTASLGVSSYTTNASNEMTANSNASYTYDSNGNTLTKTVGSNTTSYTWDYENRLTSVTLPGTSGTVMFKYDPFGRRIEKSSSATTSIFAYDSDNLIEETNVSGAVVSRYTQTQNIDEPLAILRTSATNYYDADGLGSITSLTNSSGAMVETYTYDSFGNLTASSGSLTNPFQYTGRESDPETGLYYDRARYYDSGAGRFINEDPIEFAAGINFYRYVHNRPSTMIDPSGEVDVIHHEEIVIEPNVDADCRDSAHPNNETAGGCNKVDYDADYQCKQEPCSKSWRGHVTVTLRGDIYVTSGPFPYLGRKPADKTAIDRAGLIAHEEGHTSDKLNAILPIFNSFESMSFISFQECENAAVATMIGARARWAQAGVESQQRRQ